MASSDQDQQRRVEPCNEVLVLGRVSGSPVERELPSGDLVVSWRVVIDRPGRAVPGVRTATVDSIDCLAWAAGLRRSGRSLVDGDVVQVGGLCGAASGGSAGERRAGARWRPRRSDGRTTPDGAGVGTPQRLTGGGQKVTACSGDRLLR